jgi:hypothetical protein
MTVIRFGETKTGGHEGMYWLCSNRWFVRRRRRCLPMGAANRLSGARRACASECIPSSPPWIAVDVCFIYRPAHRGKHPPVTIDVSCQKLTPDDR